MGFRFDQTQIFHAWPVNFAYYERVKWDAIQHVGGIRLVSRLAERLRSFQFSSFHRHKMQDAKMSWDQQKRQKRAHGFAFNILFS